MTDNVRVVMHVIATSTSGNTT